MNTQLVSLSLFIYPYESFISFVRIEREYNRSSWPAVVIYFDEQ